MFRLSTIFILICMALIAGAFAVVLYAAAGLAPLEAGTIALAALTLMILYNAISMRMHARHDPGARLGDLSRGVGDLARQMSDFGRRLAALETRIAAVEAQRRAPDASVTEEINELGLLVRQLAVSVAAHEDALNDQILAPPPARERETAAAAIIETDDIAIGSTDNDAEEVPSQAAPPHEQARDEAGIRAALREAIDANRIEVYLQPLVTLPQRKVRFYEALARLPGDDGKMIDAGDFIHLAEADGLMGRLDNLVLLRCVQVLRRLKDRKQDVSLFCNLSISTLRDPVLFAECLEFLDANRALTSSLILEFRQGDLQTLSPLEREHLTALVARGVRLSMDHVTDLRLNPRDLTPLGIRFVKVEAALLLNEEQALDIHAADLSDLLNRYGIDLVATHVETERAVADLLDYDLRFGQGHLFSPPRPVRPEGASSASASAFVPLVPKLSEDDAEKSPPRKKTGMSALARQLVRPN